ncbi:hypothetical protein HanXRQr2_Chr11g0490721 [Helianthus annuus]|uniref:Uncharacterized protein n=1 Tax=Helianthus annuus TaxID=4232 RepID=A0A9K3N013_HELAN|nr:hypothetical protein HanXRQr2_Chr11g0490721 [Helianthus annuus]
MRATRRSGPHTLQKKKKDREQGSFCERSIPINFDKHQNRTEGGSQVRRQQHQTAVKRQATTERKKKKAAIKVQG